MNIIEVILFVLAYSTILLTIFVSLICYRRNLERWETIAFFVSILFLILALSLPSFFSVQDADGSINIFILLSMILVSATTPLDMLANREHRLSPVWKKVVVLVPAILFVLTLVAYFMNRGSWIESVVVVYLGLAVASSMIFTWFSKPNKTSAHLEKANRYFSLAFMVIVPLALVFDFVLPDLGYDVNIDFTLPLVFFLLASYKLYDDLNRLSLFKDKEQPLEQHFKNYQISAREKEIVQLLIKGKTYKEISEELFISVSTVKTHASNIYSKCGVKNRNELNHLFYN